VNIERIKAALSTDYHSRNAYTGQITQTSKVTVLTENGTPIEVDVTFFISWDTMKDMLKLVSTRAGITE